MLLLCLLLLAADPSPTDAQRKATVAYLQSLQQADGGFLPAAGERHSTLRGTSASLRALKYFGGAPKDAINTPKFVESCRDKRRGGFADLPGGKTTAPLTASGLMAMVELKMPTVDAEKLALAYFDANCMEFEDIRMAAAGMEAVKKLSSTAAEWRDELLKTQNADGTFGKGDALARETGGKVACVLRLGHKTDKGKDIVAALDKAIGKDGGFAGPDAKGPDLETTYRVLRTYVMLGHKPAAAVKVRGFVASCRNDDGGYGAKPGAKSSAGGTYFAAIILHWLDRK